MDKNQMPGQDDDTVAYLKSRLLIAENDAENLEKALADALREFNRVNDELTAVYASRRWKLAAAFPSLGRDGKPLERTAKTETAEPLRLDEKTILVIDHHVPEYDKNAGDRSMFGYIQLFAAMGYHVVFIGDDFEAKEPYLSALAEMGVTVLAGEYYASHWRDWIAQNAAHIFAAVISRPLVAKRFMRYIKENTNALILYFGVDLHFLREQRGVDTGASATRQEEIEVLRAIEHAAMHDADAVLMYNDDEKAIIKKEFGVDAVTVPLYFYYDIPARKTAFADTKDILFVGGFAHKPNVDAMRWFVAEIVPLVRQALPDAGLVILGSDPPREILDMAAEDITVTGFVTDVELAEYYEKCRVCVVPLRFGAGVKGKTVEAMYNGIPIVSTQIGVEGMKDIVSVIPPVGTKEDFAAQVVRMYLNEEAWTAAGNAYRKYLLEYASFTAAKEIFKKIFGDVDGRKETV